MRDDYADDPYSTGKPPIQQVTGVILVRYTTGSRLELCRTALVGVFQHNLEDWLAANYPGWTRLSANIC